MTAFIDGLLAGYGIAIPVGAISILIVNTSMQCGFRIGFMAGAGAATADLIYAMLAAVAGAALVSVLAPIAPQLRVVSGFVLIGLAIFGMRSGLRRPTRQAESARNCPPWQMYLQFLGITLINPLTIVYFSALILGRGQSSTLIGGDYIPFIGGVALSSLSWQSFIAALGGFAHGRLSERFQKSAVVVGNILIFTFGTRILYQLWA